MRTHTHSQLISKSKNRQKLSAQARRPPLTWSYFKSAAAATEHLIQHTAKRHPLDALYIAKVVAVGFYSI